MEIRGSEWRKWDLHIHSPYCCIRGSGSYSGVTDEMFIEKLKEENISAIGLTNYFRFEDQDYDLAEKLRRNKICTFMNLELRLTNINDNKHLADYHIIFSDELSRNDIDNFLSNLDVTTGGSHKKANTLTEEELEKAAVSFNDLQSVLGSKSLNLKNKYITAFLSRGHGNSVSGRGRVFTVYEDISRRTDILVHSSTLSENLEIDREYWLGKTCEANKYIKPVLQSSDAHCLEDIGIKKVEIEEKNKDRSWVYQEDDKYYIDVPAFTWIKSDPCFEGLKQILYEPEERVRYGVNYPVEKEDYLVIDSISYDNGEVVRFNEGLNAIIGGRSTGKSTLINSIAEYQGSKNYDVHYTLYGDYEVIWADGVIDPNRELEFIPQEYMINITQDTDKFNDLLRDVISKKGMDDEIRQYDERLAGIKQKINGKLDNYFQLIETKKNLIKPEGDKQGAKTSIAVIESKIADIRLSNRFSEDDNCEYIKVCQEQEKLKEEIKILEKELEHINEIKDTDFSKWVNFYEFSYEKQEIIKEKLNEIREYSEKQWSLFVRQLKEETTQLKLEKENVLKELRELDIFIRGKQLEEQNEELKRLEQQLIVNKIIKQNIEQYEKRCSELENELTDLSDSIVENFENYYINIAHLKDRFSIKEKDLQIEIKTSEYSFNKKIDYLDARNACNNDFIKQFEKHIMSLSDDSSREFFKSIFSNNNLVFNRYKTINDLIRDIFSTNWYTYDYKVTYQDDEFKNMSQGKKSFVILKLLLEFSEDKKPVLIDQPEDSLDNRAIYHELRGYLLDTKKSRQVILVTHNPNVVVGADAENIIVAHQHNILEKNRDGKKFLYINGALENTRPKDDSCEYILESQGIREHMFDILEGGEEAFEKRKQKYNYRKQ